MAAQTDPCRHEPVLESRTIKCQQRKSSTTSISWQGSSLPRVQRIARFRTAFPSVEASGMKSNGFVPARKSQTPIPNEIYSPKSGSSSLCFFTQYRYISFLLLQCLLQIAKRIEPQFPADKQEISCFGDMSIGYYGLPGKRTFLVDHHLTTILFLSVSTSKFYTPALFIPHANQRGKLCTLHKFPRCIILYYRMSQFSDPEGQRFESSRSHQKSPCNVLCKVIFCSLYFCFNLDSATYHQWRLCIAPAQFSCFAVDLQRFLQDRLPHW